MRATVALNSLTYIFKAYLRNFLLCFVNISGMRKKQKYLPKLVYVLLSIIFGLDAKHQRLLSQRTFFRIGKLTYLLLFQMMKIKYSPITQLHSKSLPTQQIIYKHLMRLIRKLDQILKVMLVITIMMHVHLMSYIFPRETKAPESGKRSVNPMLQMLKKIALFLVLVRKWKKESIITQRKTDNHSM